MFRSLRFYRLDDDWPTDEAELSARLATVAFTPCGPFSEQSAGFEAPSGVDADPLFRRVAGADLLRVRRQVRLLPAAAVNEALPERLAEYEARMGREASRKERRQLRDEVYGELLPRSLLRSDRLQALALHRERLLVIDAAVPARAELVLDRLRDAFGSLKVRPLTFRDPVSTLLSRILLGDGPRELRLGRECRLNDPASARSAVQWTDMDLSDEEPRTLLQSGLRLLRLGVEFEELCTGVVDQDGVWRKVRWPDVAAAEVGDEDPLARLDTETTLLAGAVRRLVTLLERVLGSSEGS
ncbi:MAG: recombination-associated protein RdgC [Pseudomonadales bacterium]